jgi:hypothetical protein
MGMQQGETEMSAFLVSHDHIDALLSFAKDKRMKDRLAHYTGDQFADWTKIGSALLTENVRSLNTRYPDTIDNPENMPGKIGETYDGYSFRYFQPFMHMQHVKKCVWVIKACDCFDYQACETEDYRESNAATIVNNIRREAVRCLPDYDAAPWEINRDRVKESA